MAEREAKIGECKELWQEIEKSGLSKSQFLRSADGKKWLAKGYFGDCPLCEYVNTLKEKIGACYKCPLMQQFGMGCHELGYRGGSVSQPSFFKAIRELK